MPAPAYIVALLLAAAVSLGAWLETRAAQWSASRAQAPNMLAVLLGDGRRLFANHFFLKADVYFHSGYYPTIFDAKKLHERPAMASQDAHDHEEHAHDHKHDEHAKHEAEEHHEAGEDILGPPRDWIDRFGRNFFVARHTHLPEGRQREMLPWFRLAASLDPNQVENYTVAAFWLRHLKRVDEAEQFLREGWRLNPDNPEILFELGRLFYHDRKDTARARNVWELALKHWRQREAGKTEPDKFLGEQILANLAQLEYEQQNWARAISHLEELKPLSPIPAEIQKQIDALKAKLPR